MYTYLQREITMERVFWYFFLDHDMNQYSINLLAGSSIEIL